IVLVALSGYVVTPYDNLGYLLTALAVVVALTGRPWSPPMCLVLAVAGTATRESFAVAVVAVAAALLGQHGRRALGRLRDPIWWSAAALAAGWVGTYVTLRIVVPTDPKLDTALSRTVLHDLNWQMSSLLAVLFYALGAVTLQMTWPALAGAARRRWRTTRLALWLLATPYLVVCITQGIWFEAMRLLMPILLSEHILRRLVADGSVAEPALGDDRIAVDPKVLTPQRNA